ncbi:tRNA (uridine(34)/cytosine(34)/5-carboxymethylaminomethyluridine(34)-2'-O)-methyltransferase TrmL [Beggiatoa leptomitoformis]|uniref:tRNA (cytidine(34)-2'-O)-methyltransferase n=1 Tax=Beggiatoa leptomitoformis TaxID=288004 RepID=A0A2N9YGA5_9GAMM|nr:tRNA (uridine(34)/cytosine(34)/5-carboxymethylaminomethyluridine(34)-2'-O)-methyltransferase TrmL [Beggiatoa leptomitoformis]ALG68145.1 tRNA (uridine(34)/cytosine(34)/5-carboxymethylaminomethyluridine(34)-2'-O)-methyltransferase TrmL [Beggiatoa leptomitoformis]AUI69558.1 tRNA (uridine(34)/cytosine(34)/5-carboxymethylaminomethyluridine(34)-2'-O)-methyltransferase TrmL [Beggiatoa leptomitoformis]
MFHCVLHQPEIPPNTGNVIRLCANTQVQLHLIHPLGFSLDDKRMRRAGLDYHEWVNVKEYQSLDEFLAQVKPNRLFVCETCGEQYYTDCQYQAGDAFLFGSETKGLPDAVLAQFSVAQMIRIPMRTGNRSLNLSNSVAVVIYEAWRQLGFV